MRTIATPPPTMTNIHQYWDQPVDWATRPARPMMIRTMAKTMPPPRGQCPLTINLADSRMTPSAPQPISRYAQKLSHVTMPVKPDDARNSSVPRMTTPRPKMTALTMIQNGDQVQLQSFTQPSPHPPPQ